MDFETIMFIANKILIVFIIFLFSYLGFYSIRNNKRSIFLPFLSTLWLPVIFLSELFLTILFSDSFSGNNDIAVFGLSLICLPIGFTIAGFIQLDSYLKSPPYYTKHNWLEIILLSLLPAFLLLSYLFYYKNEFSYLESFVFIGLILFDKLVLLNFQYYFIQTGLKILFITYFIYAYSYYPIESLIILITDCMLGYVLYGFIENYRLKQYFNYLSKSKL